jgi:hypothetical protein
MPISASLGVSAASGIIRNRGKDSRNLVPLAVCLTVKRRTATRIYALFAIVAGRENRVFLNFSKYLHEISRK